MSFKSRLVAHHGQECPYCGVTMQIRKPSPTKRPEFPTKDHIVPRWLQRRGAQTVYVCLKCNQDKDCLPIETWHGLLDYKGDPRAERVKRFIEENVK